ncbi:sensor histidine kinase [Luteolibacter arcticus]|uniref:Sensor histidine kinase n=1 Tax=Luteolibacter arcticus TaxID=1581411 RepID=A0ABT3GQD1_9BACT|nr:sensor histidine kinase [Luteolibacter arcticus]MCW1925683.1 sensor histidine kinase [Luteolibacter arcticus]
MRKHPGAVYAAQSLLGAAGFWCVLGGPLPLHAEHIPLTSAKATFHSGTAAELAHVIDDIESGPFGWSVAPKFSEPQSLVVHCAKPVEATELDISLFFLSGRPNASIAEFALSYTTDDQPSLNGNWESLVIQRYAAEVVNLTRLEDGHLRSSVGPAGVNGVIPDDTYRLVVQVPRGRATGFRIEAFPLLDAKGAPRAMSWSHVRDFVLTEFRVAEHVRATTNIALHCPVKSSHPLYGVMKPGALTDGLPATLAHPLDEALGAGFHFDIDLGRSAAFDHINLRGRGDEWLDRFSRVLIRIYEEDPDTGAPPVWEGLDRADGSHPAPGEHDVIRASLGKGSFRGRYMRLSSDSPVPLSPQLAEVEVYESRAPEVVSALADGREIPVSGGLDLPPGVRRLSLRLRIPQIGKPTGTLLRWRVRGDLEEWQTSQLLTIDMPCPPPGKMVFEAQALHSDREWNATVLSLPIHARQHFWESHLVQGLASGATLLAAVWLARFLTKRRAARQLDLIRARASLAEERTRIARDLHDDLGANLARIGFLTEIAGRSIDDPEHVRLQLEKIYGTARDLTRQLGTVVWAVDPANDTLESFARYLHGHAEEYLGIAGIRCHFTSTEAMPAMRLSSTLRYHLLMIAKESLHNVVKHAGASLVAFSIAITDKDLILEISDNGRGLPPADAMKPGNGLANMQSRAAAIGGHCVFLSPPEGTGSVIRLTLPLNQLESTSTMATSPDLLAHS